MHYLQDFPNHRKKTNRAVVFSCRPTFSPTFLSTGTTNETFQQSEKQDSFRHTLKSSTGIHESSGSQFFRTTTGIQSGPDIFGKSRFVMTFLNILRVTGILNWFRLILKGNKGKEILELSRLELLEKFLAKNFALSGAKGNTSRWLNRGSIADSSLLKTKLAIWESRVLTAKFLRSGWLSCLISTCKFDSFKNPLAMITNLSECYLRFRIFILLAQTKKWFLRTMAAAALASENYGDEWGFTWYLQEIYTWVPTWNH